MTVTTTPLTLAYKVTSIRDACELAELVSEAEQDPLVPLGPAIDAVLRYLHNAPLLGLYRDADQVLVTLRALGPHRAERATDWLSRHAQDDFLARHWSLVSDTLRTEREAHDPGPDLLN